MNTHLAFDIDAPAPWLLLTRSDQPSPTQTVCQSLRDALIKAYESAKAGNEPMKLVLSETHLDAHQIFALWREHGFVLPPNA